MTDTTGGTATPVWCGIDVGTSGVRAVIVGERGEQFGEGTAALPSGHRDGVRHEQSPLKWWDALVTAVRDALAQADGAVCVEALSLDATSGTLVVEDADGAAVGPALMYDDARAAEYAPRVRQAGAALWDELGYRIQSSWSLPKILWLLEHDAVPVGGRIAHQGEHLLRRLAGVPVPTDTSTALKSGLDTRAAAWPWPLLNELGVAQGLLPEVVLPGREIAVVGAAAAVATGLRAGTPIKAGMTDGCAAQIAAGALTPGSWSSALGTTLVVKGATLDPVRDPSGAVYCHRHPDGGWLPGGASSSGAGAIAAAFPGHDKAAFEALSAAADRLVPFPGVTYPLTGTGERFPFAAAQAHGLLAAEATGPESRFAALCQAIAYVERLAYDVLGSLGADVSGPVALSGSAARNSWWNQLRTDVLGRPTLLPASVQAATGAAVLAAAPPGELAATAARMVRIERTYTPDPERGGRLRGGYVRLLEELAGRGWLEPALADGIVNGQVGA